MAFTDSSFAGNSASSNEYDERKIFVGGLSWGTTDEDLREYFGRYGTILDCVLKVDPMTGRSRGFGFVLFSDNSVVEEILAQTHTLKGRNITPRKLRKGMNRGREPILKVFVGGLDPSVPEQDIWDHFGCYGKVTDLDLPFDGNKGCRRAFCFVSFDTEEAVDAACKDEKQEIGGKWVDVKRAIPRTSRNGWYNNARGGSSTPSYGMGGGTGGYNSRNGTEYGRGGGGSGYGNYSGVSYNTGYSTGYGGKRDYNSSGYSNGYSSGNGSYGASTSYGGGGSYGGSSYGNGNAYSGGSGGSYGNTYGNSYSSRSTTGGRGGRVQGGQGTWGRQTSGSYGGSGAYGYYNNNYDGYD